MLLELILPSIKVLGTKQVFNIEKCVPMVMIVMFVTILSVQFDHEHQDCTVFTFSLNACLSAVNEHNGQYGMEKTIQNTSEEGVLQYYLHICKHSDKIYTLCFNNLGCCVLCVLFSKHK